MVVLNEKVNQEHVDFQLVELLKKMEPEMKKRFYVEMRSLIGTYMLAVEVVELDVSVVMVEIEKSFRLLGEFVVSLERCSNYIDSNACDRVSDAIELIKNHFTLLQSEAVKITDKTTPYGQFHILADGSLFNKFTCDLAELRTLVDGYYSAWSKNFEDKRAPLRAGIIDKANEITTSEVVLGTLPKYRLKKPEIVKPLVIKKLLAAFLYRS